ncbi:Oidioi.mRNA.OKI2018_I69.PAR.g11262.t1.cds [Oikopleura dioica]|uniref:V-type proton ATPase subunit G n=1 Tax=Oikopleura dioica TaxID=34765 RepID=A0ABN7RYD8_OIKDI|nr:Oidioi.mRNA.OKI2018_I69.PAR.g11262.t1.cds [Oikopleura dioica]
MASQSEGIQKLLEAEKEAQKEVDAARRVKAKKLKQAKEEAKVEIQQFNKEREAQFKAKEAEVMGGREELQRWIAEQTKGQIDEMAARVNQYQAQVIHDLVSAVQDIQPQLPRNFRG